MDETLSLRMVGDSSDMRSLAAFARMASLPFSGAGGMGMPPSARVATALHSRTSVKSTEERKPLKATASDWVRRAMDDEQEACDSRGGSRQIPNNYLLQPSAQNGNQTPIPRIFDQLSIPARGTAQGSLV